MERCLTRRSFLAAACAGATVVALGGCSVGAQEEAEAPRASSEAGDAGNDEPISENVPGTESGGAAKEGDMGDKGKVLVAYFSNTGNTEAVAERLAAMADAELFRIEPATPYSPADLDYNDDDARCMRELNDPASRPEVASAVPDWDAYGTVLLGYPLWWSRTPPIMQTFAESYDWTGKTVAPFCTSGSSPIGQSAEVLESETPGATWLSGRRFSREASDGELETWLASIGIE